MGANALENVRDTFSKDGVVCFPGALSTTMLEMAEDAFNWSLRNPSPNATTFESTRESPGRFFEDIDNVPARRIYHPFLEQSGIGRLAAAVWGSESVWYLYEQVFLKDGGAVRRTPWHQDTSYMPISGKHLAVAWISLDPLSRSESLEFVRGSHRGPTYAPLAFDPADDTALHEDGAGMRPLPNIESHREAWDIVSWAINPGDVVVFHPASLHGGAPISEGRRRRTLALRFFGEDAVYGAGDRGLRHQTGVTGSFDIVASELVQGQVLRHPLFARLL